MMNTKKSIKSDDGIDISILSDTVPQAKALVIFAHGAGANMSHEFMSQLTTLFNQSNISVLRFNFPFMDKRDITGKKHPPDRMPKLLSCYNAVINYVVECSDFKSLPLYIGGKSMGSRVAAMLVGSDNSIGQKPLDLIKGVYCIGYPFHPTNKPDKLRLEPLQLASKEVLIVQGERDTLGNKLEVESYELPKHCHCVYLPDGDHSLKPRVKSGFTLIKNQKEAVKQISSFIDKYTS